MGRPKDYYASVFISVEDVLSRRPEWSAKQARQWLKEREEQLHDTMRNAGTETLTEMLEESPTTVATV